MRRKELTTKEKRALFNTDERIRADVFKELMVHLQQGFSVDSFETLSAFEIEKYLTMYPQEFLRDELESSMRAGKGNWESIGRRQADGSCLGNSRSWFYNMANRYGWRDKIDLEAEHSGAVSVNIVNYARTPDSTDAPK